MVMNFGKIFLKILKNYMCNLWSPKIPYLKEKIAKSIYFMIYLFNSDIFSDSCVLYGTILLHCLFNLQKYESYKDTLSVSKRL